MDYSITYFEDIRIDIFREEAPYIKGYIGDSLVYMLNLNWDDFRVIYSEKDNFIRYSIKERIIGSKKQKIERKIVLINIKKL